MAYTHSKYEVEIQPFTPATAGGPTADANGLQIGVTGIAGQWAPGAVPHSIRMLSVTPLVTTNADAAISIGFEADLTTPGTPTRLATIVVPTAGAVHKTVYHVPTYNIELKPGQIMDVRVTAAATAGVYAKVVAYVEPRWEQPGNLTGMLAST